MNPHQQDSVTMLKCLEHLRIEMGICREYAMEYAMQNHR